MKILNLISKPKRMSRSVFGVLLASLALHGLGLLVFGGRIVFRYFRRPPVQFVVPPPTQRLEPRKLEMNIHAVDLSKSSGRPRVKPRLTAVGHASQIALPQIKADLRATDKKLSRDLSAFGAAGFGSGIGGGYGTGIGGGMGGMGMATVLPAQLSPVLAGRCSQQGRVLRIRESGGSTECEDAVIRGLRWLKTHQNADGSWGGQHQGAMTGLALLSFLGHCETFTSPEFGGTVRKAVDWLLAQGEAQGGWLVTEQGNGRAYAQGIATYALAEAYSLTRLARIAPVLEKSAKIVMGGQNSTGGWVYNYASEGSDSSVTGWQIQALKATHLSGLNVEGLDACLDRAIENIKAHQCADGSITYRRGDGGGKWSLTGVGVVACQMWHHKDDQTVRKGLEYILARKTLSYNGDCSLYGWYYNTLACFLSGGSKWSK